MDAFEKEDREYAAKHSLPLVEARKQRLDGVARAERRRQEDAKVLRVLFEDQDRYVVSFDGKKTAPREGMEFVCPACKAPQPDITAQLIGMARELWPNLSQLPESDREIGNDFEKVSLPHGGTVPMFEKVNTCRSCKGRTPLRIVLVPY